MEEFHWGGRRFVDYAPEDTEGSKGKVRVLSFNLYADYRCLSNEVRHTTAKTFQRRGPLLISEIRSYNADILCLQDVEHFRDFWSPQLTLLGYDCVFHRRTHFREHYNEGVVVAYKRENFQLFKTASVDMNDATKGNDSITQELRSASFNDDVGLIAFLQPWNEGYLKSALCVVSAQFSDRDEHSTVRRLQAEYLTRCVEEANADFLVPVVMGLSLFDDPSSPTYHVLRSGRLPLRPEIPRKPAPPLVEPLSRGSAALTWLPPRRTAADLPFLGYCIAWRPGGSTTLSYRSSVEVPISGCIQYTKQRDAHGVVRTVAKKELRYILNGLSSDIPFEFKVCAVSKMGQGVWSDPSDVCILKASNPTRLKTMPPLVFLKDEALVQQLRESEGMGKADWDVEKSASQQIRSSTHLTPRHMDGSLDPQASRTRVLPHNTNPRSGWDDHLHGGINTEVKDALANDKLLKRSLLRDTATGEFAPSVSDNPHSNYATAITDDDELKFYERTQGAREQEEEEARFGRSVGNSYQRRKFKFEPHKDPELNNKVQEMPTVSDTQSLTLVGVETSELNESASEIDDRFTDAANFHKKRGTQGTAPPPGGFGEGSLTAHSGSLSQLSQAGETLEGGEGEGGGLEGQFSSSLVSDEDSLLYAPLHSHAHSLPTGSLEAGSQSLYSHSETNRLPGGGTTRDGLGRMGHLFGEGRGAAARRADDDLLLDAHEATRGMGVANARSVHALALRSAYERYSVGGEPLFTFSMPAEPAVMPPRGTRCVDYIFYSHVTLGTRRVLSVPTLAAIAVDGDDPREPALTVDPGMLRPYANSAQNFDRQTQVGQSLHPTRTEINRAKAELKRALAEASGPRDIVPGSFVPLLVPNAMRRNSTLPNKLYGSSHLALAVELDILKSDGNMPVEWR